MDMLTALFLTGLVIVVGGLSGLGLAGQGGGWRRTDTPDSGA